MMEYLAVKCHDSIGYSLMVRLNSLSLCVYMVHATKPNHLVNLGEGYGYHHVIIATFP